MGRAEKVRLDDGEVLGGRFAGEVLLKENEVSCMGVVGEGEVGEVCPEVPLFTWEPGTKSLCWVLLSALPHGTHLPPSGPVPCTIIETQFLISSRKKKKERGNHLAHSQSPLQPWRLSVIRLSYCL